MLAALEPEADNSSSDIDSLQTDIMRFFAIVCLCLLAVFAAVSGTPSASSQDALAAAEQARAEALSEAARAQAQLAASEANNRVLREDLDRLIGLHAALQQDHQALQAELDTSEAAQEVAAAAVDQLQSQVSQQQDALTALQASVEAVPDVQEPAMPTAPPAPAPVEAAESNGTPSDQEEGFTLEFASEAALRSVLATDAVSLVVQRGQRAWRVDSVGGRLSAQSAGDVQVFPLLAESLSPELRREVQAVLPSGSGVSSWGVALDAGIRSELEQRMNDQRGGRLVIQRDARVELLPSQREQ